MHEEKEEEGTRMAGQEGGGDGARDVRWKLLCLVHCLCFYANDEAARK